MVWIPETWSEILECVFEAPLMWNTWYMQIWKDLGCSNNDLRIDPCLDSITQECTVKEVAVIWSRTMFLENVPMTNGTHSVQRKNHLRLTWLETEMLVICPFIYTGSSTCLGCCPSLSWLSVYKQVLPQVGVLLC